MNLLLGLFLIGVYTIGPSLGQQQQHDAWDEINIVCPLQCMCQRSHLLDLAIARWTKVQYGGEANDDNQPHQSASHQNQNHNNNEVNYTEDEMQQGTENPFMKLAMCMLQDSGNGNDVNNVIVSLPPDVQALVLMYNNGADKNISLFVSDLKELKDLIVLEVRATNQGAFRVYLDEPLPKLRYANFETVELVGTKQLAPNPVHPSDLFDYVPESERLDYNISIVVEHEIEIVPYEEYVIAEKRAKMASFNGYGALRVLQIHRCQLDELHWEMFDGLNQLHHLSLEHNGIKIVPPFAFFGARQIRTLSLARNLILDLNYRALAGLLRLEWLDLSNNQMTHVSELTFPPFPKLQTVDFRNNPLRNIFPMSFGVMNQTQHVSVGSPHVALDLSREHIFRDLSDLKSLRIENGTAESLHENVFRGLRGVQKLIVRGSIRRIEYDTFAEMANMRELVLSDCQLEEVSMDVIYGANSLELVDLSRNRLSYLPPGMFDGQTKLKEVYLQNNQLSRLPRDIFGMVSLRLLRITDNPFQCSCHMSFWKQHITNAIRKGRSNQKCLADPTVPSRMQCNSNQYSFEYGFDAKMTPRCDGGPDEALGRSVYYSMRKTLACPSTVVKATPQELAKRTAHLTEKQMRALKRHRKVLMTQNSLNYQLAKKLGNVVVDQKKPEANDQENRL